jgi:hypothetical protein
MPVSSLSQAVVGTILLLLLPSRSPGQPQTVNFRFAPAHYQTIICMPDDWLKTFVSEQGALAYDCGPGPYARPLTEIAVGLKETDLRVTRQYLEDPRVPIVTTLFQTEGQTVRQEAFTVATENSPIPSNDGNEKRVTRLGGFNGCVSWAVPPTGTDPAFWNVAWGTNRPIRYSVKVKPRSRKLVAIGLCEAHKWGPKTRLMELHVEGASPLTADPMKDSTKNRPYVYLFRAFDKNGDGQLAIESHASPKSPDPNVILNAFWVFPENFPVTEDKLVRGELSSKAEVYYSCGTELEDPVPSVRVDAIHALFSDPHAVPVIKVRTRRDMRFTTSGDLRSGGSFFLYSRPKALSAVRGDEGWTLHLPAGTQEAEVIVVHGLTAPAIPPLPEAIKNTRSIWMTRWQIPHDHIVVPDSGIQYLLDASIRTIYQVRDVVEGHAQFQPGPTVYRGLWAGDAMLTDIAVMTLGDTAGAREYLETVLRHQLPSGQIRSLYPAVSLPETPAVLAALCIYAKSYADSAWLRKQWPHVIEGMNWIEQMHRQTLKDPSAPDYGLMPPSFVDGGIADQTTDYSTVWWTLISLERVIDAARWLRLDEQVPRWRGLLDNISEAWRKSAQKDLAKDRFGNTYLPIVVGDTLRGSPQRGQFAFLCPFPYGRFFVQPDSLLHAIVHGNLAMLDSTLQEGLVCGSGWVTDGVWPWLGGVHGIAHDLAGNPVRAQELLYAFANHATPTGTWVEEQSLKAKGERTGGDVSDAEASAVFVYHVRRLLVHERLDDLELLAGFPDAWLAAGSTTTLNRVFTEFGPLSLNLSVSADGSSAELRLSAIDGRGNKGTPVVFLQTLKREGFEYTDGRPLPDKLPWTWGKELSLRCRRNPQAVTRAK